MGTNICLFPISAIVDTYFYTNNYTFLLDVREKFSIFPMGTIKAYIYYMQKYILRGQFFL